MVPHRKVKRQDNEDPQPTRRSKRLKSEISAQEEPSDPTSSKAQQASSSGPPNKYPTTPDGHYFVVRGRLWRCANPSLSTADRVQRTKALMAARRDVGTRGRKGGDVKEARDRVQEAKEALGERGGVWWDEGEVCDRKMVWNTGYKAWWEEVGSKQTEEATKG